MNEYQISSQLRYLTDRIVGPLMGTDRHNVVPGSSRRESVAEHSFHLACAAMELATSFPPLDQAKCVRIALQHDFAEALTGDVSVYAPLSDRHEKPQREAIAIGELRKEGAGVGLVMDGLSDYAVHTSREALFVSALDKIVPYFLVLAGTGHHAHPSIDEYQATSQRARSHIERCFDPLLPVFDLVAADVGVRVASLNSERGRGRLDDSPNRADSPA